MSLESFRRSLALAVLALSAGSAGVSAATARDDVPGRCRPAVASADRIEGPGRGPLPFLGATGPAAEVVAREAGSTGPQSAEGRHRADQPRTGSGRAAVRSPQSVHAADRRRLRLAPGLARAAAGRLGFFATAPPFPIV